ncbi:MAG: excalibur calcium-binding domain-containing protein [Candidatus Competibacteraceae bacterium]|nr:excalibur calcium-binding domain-containing protein [Candidatus Competibacteraceae bacterium]
MILGAGWYGNYLYKQRYGEWQSSADSTYKKSIGGSLTVVPSQGSNRVATTTNFKCDGRTHCSQMTSCEEATFFLRNCPNVKMDGNNDGVPCEKQWCH